MAIKTPKSVDDLMVDDADRASAEPDPTTWDKPTRRTRDWLDKHFTRIPKDELP